MKNFRRKIKYGLLIGLTLASVFGFSLKGRAASLPPDEGNEPSSTEESTEAPAEKVGIRFIVNNGNELLMSSEYALIKDEYGKTVTEAVPGEYLYLQTLIPENSVKVVTSVILYTDKNGTGAERSICDSHYFQDRNDNKYMFQMRSLPMIIELKTDVDPVLESSSVAESESVAASISESESISESVEFEKNSCAYGDFRILFDLSGTEPPLDGFVMANDTTSFEKKVKAYYSTTYRLFVYYAEKKDGEPGFYVMNPMDDTLSPFGTVKDAEGKVYVVTGAPSITSIPGVYKSAMEVDVSAKKNGSAMVPGYLISDSQGETLTLLYLNSEDGKRGFYVYETLGNSATVKNFSDYEGEKGVSVEDISEEATVKEPDTDEGSFFSNRLVWFIIVGIIILIIAAALILVFFISKKQEKEEEELDQEEADDDIDEFSEFREQDNEPFKEEHTEIPQADVPFDGSSYSNSQTMDQNIDSDPFDVNFENAFPDEVSAGISARVAPETPNEPEVTRVFDFTFDFKPQDEAGPKEVIEDGFVDVKIPETKKSPKETLSEEDFTEIDFNN